MEVTSRKVTVEEATQTVIESLTVREVVKIGNLTRDPELQYTSKGQPMIKVDLAVNPHPNEVDDQGNAKQTEFYQLLLFGTLADNMAESDIVKSSRVIVVGAPDVENWEDKETGEPKTRKKIFVNAIGLDLKFGTCTFTKVFRSNPKPANIPVDF